MQCMHAETLMRLLDEPRRAEFIVEHQKSAQVHYLVTFLKHKVNAQFLTLFIHDRKANWFIFVCNMITFILVLKH